MGAVTAPGPRRTPQRLLDGVTGRRPTVVVAVAVPQDDEVGKRSQAGPAPSIIGGRPWSTMPVSTCHWKAPAYALSTQLRANRARGQGGQRARDLDRMVPRS